MESKDENTAKGKDWIKPLLIFLTFIALYFFVTEYLYPSSYMSSDSTETGMQQLKTKFEVR